jgi:fumarate hydratase class I
MKKHLVELIKKASCQLPDDVIDALKRNRKREEKNSPARFAFNGILENIEISKNNSTPVCQDTGSNIWMVYHPAGYNTATLTKQIHSATRTAREKSYLRPNAVNPVTGQNTGDNIGRHFPTIIFHQWDSKSIAIDLMLKGGGCENVSSQNSLPNKRLNAGRDLDGVRKVVLDAIYQAQGRGCSPGIIGVGIGGDRVTGMIEAKEQLFRLLSDKNPDKELKKLETTLHKEANELGIGPMGYGGATTVLGVKAGYLHRVPASYFVSISYMCWACRRASLKISPSGKFTFSQESQIALAHQEKQGSK